MAEPLGPLTPEYVERLKTFYGAYVYDPNEAPGWKHDLMGLIATVEELWAGKAMVTYRHADGTLVGSDYSFVLDTDGYDDGNLRPVDWIRETWALLTAEEVTTNDETLYDCDNDDCDEDAVGWEKESTGEWHEWCQEHMP